MSDRLDFSIPDIERAAEDNKTRLRLEALKKRKLELLKNLPHLYAHKHYTWSREFFEATDKMTLLVAGNQLGKSSTQIKKCIHWATESSLWPELWGVQQEPNLFWYFYPSKQVATVEFEKKWKPLLPQGKLKSDAKYGWESDKEGRFINAIHFKSGVSVYFKTYAQSVHSLQSSTVFACFTDEELPKDYYDELMLRVAATDGYFSMVFTATMGQDIWWRAMECIGKENELFPQAKKMRISMYDCLEYEDGSKTPWSIERIKKIESKCQSKNEILKRVFGRFVVDSGLIYPNFDPARHIIAPKEIPEDWERYCAVDIGGGGEYGHPSAIIFIAVNPKRTKGYIYKGWRGDGIETSAGDVYNKFKELSEGEFITRKWYDWASADFNKITTRLGDPFEKAEKSHEIGVGIINTLFKADMLQIFDDFELRKLAEEFLQLLLSTPKRKAKDDLVDTVRYCCAGIPWDLSNIVDKSQVKVEVKKKMPQTKEEWGKYHDEQRARGMRPAGQAVSSEVEQEIDFWQAGYGEF